MSADRAVPTFSLQRYLDISMLRSLRLDETTTGINVPCQKLTPLGQESLLSFIDKAGEARFQEKAVRFQQELQHADAGQILYRGIFRALGYSKNKLPCLTLADRLPLSAMESVIKVNPIESKCLAELQALLFGTAGLLSSQRLGGENDDYSRYLENLWLLNLQRDVMSANTWTLYKVRPNNTPVRRIAAMSYLLKFYRQKGLFESLIEQVKNIAPDKGDSLSNGLLVPSEGYWLNHFDFGLASSKQLESLIGPDRAAEIVVNVLLTFTYAWGNLISDMRLKEKAWTLYRSCSRSPGNALEKHMLSQLGLNGRTINSALRQQGLLHIYRTLCIQGKCSECKLAYNSSFPI